MYKKIGSLDLGAIRRRFDSNRLLKYYRLKRGPFLSLPFYIPTVPRIDGNLLKYTLFVRAR